LCTVDSDSAEYVDIVAEFLLTMPSATVDTLERVENRSLHRPFEAQAVAMKDIIGADYNKATMRQILFHGTTAVDDIVHSTDGHGFLPLLSGSRCGATYGDGTYFARNASYSHKYSQRISNGQHKMIVAEVLVGRSTKGRQGDKKMPPLPGEAYKKYNSLVDSVADPSIFVVQHSNQAYPAYLLTYHT